MAFRIEHYRKIDGVRTFPDSYIAWVYQRLLNDGSIESIFYDGSVRNAQDFIRVLKRSVTIIAFQNADPIALSWVNDFHHKWGQLHFAFMSTMWGRHDEQEQVANLILREFLYRKCLNGQFCFDALLGVVPVRNRKAWAFVERTQPKIIGVMPYGVWVAESGQSEAARMVVHTRETVNENLY